MRNFLTLVLISAALAQTSIVAAGIDTSDAYLAQKLSKTYAFYQAMTCGNQSPGSAETKALLDIASELREKKDASVYLKLEIWLQQYPSSPWAPSVRANLARYYEDRGRHSLALDHWSAIWASTKESPESSQKYVAEASFAYMTRVLLGLGSVTELDQLMAETDGRDFADPTINQMVKMTRGQYRAIRLNTDVGFRCGSIALSSVAVQMRAPVSSVERIKAIPSPVTGFSLSRLAKIAQASQVDLVPAKATSPKELIAPSIVHWKLNHFAAILEKKGSLYRVHDPALGRDKWMSSEDILAESSGYFLVSEKSCGSEFQNVDESEGNTVFGRGWFINIRDCQDGCANGSGGGGSGSSSSTSSSSGSAGLAGPSGGKGKGGCTSCGGGGGNGGSGKGCPTCPDGSTPPGKKGNGPDSNGPGGMGPQRLAAAGDPGMPVWSVSEPYINLWLFDEPLGYVAGFGERVSFQLTYKQRGKGYDEAYPSSGVFSFGEGWYSSWLSCVREEVPPDYATPGYAILANAGGGERSYVTDGSANEFFSMTRMERIPALGPLQGYVLKHADGSKQEFMCYRWLSPHMAFLTARIDPQGRATRFVYDPDQNVAKLLYVVDVDGRTNRLYYENQDNPLLVTKVEDPFGNQADLGYLTYIPDDETSPIQYLLTSITDVCNLTSTIGYDHSSGWVTNLTTPYGATSFEHAEDSANDGKFPMRTIRVVDPESRTNVYVLRQYSEGIYTNSTSYEFFLPNIVPTNITPTLFGGPEMVNGIILDTNGLPFRNSFHWGPLQAQELPLDLTKYSASDYRRAGMKHWMHGGGEESISHLLSLEFEPSPDGTNFGQSTWYVYFWEYGVPPWQPNPISLPQVVAQVLPDGTTAYEWYHRDDWGRPTNVVSTYSLASGQTPFTRTNSYIYAANGIDLLYQTDVGGDTNASYVYDSNHRLLRITNATGGVSFYNYDNKGRLTSAKSAAGLTTTNIYFASGPYTNWISKTIDLEIGRTNSYTYTNNHVWTHADPYGLIVTNTWDALNRLVRVDYPDGTSSRNVYDRLDLVRTYDRMGYTNSYAYDNARRLIAQTNALGSFKLYQYCACGGVENVHDAEGNDTAYVYDKAGRLVQTILPGASFVTYTRNFLGQITSVVDTSGLAVTNWYNNQGLLYASSNMFGCTKLVLYDNEDHATNTLDANGIRVSMTYDVAGRLATRTYPDNGVERFVYSQRGMVAYTNQIGMPTFYAYDVAGQKTAETNANNEVTVFRYDPSGNLTNLVDGNLHNTYWKYNQYGQVTNKLDHLGNSMFRYAYNANGWLISRITPAKGETTYTYDAGGNLKTVNYPTSHDIALQYDIMGRLTNMVDALGVTSFAFGALGQMTMEDGPWDSDTVRYTYANKLREALELEQPGSSPWVQEYDHDASRRLTGIVSPAGQFGYDYSRSGQASPGTLISRLTIPTGGWITNEFDVNGRLLKTSLKNSHNVLTNSHAYVYNQANQRTQQVFTAGNYTAYTYDKIGQLTRSLGREPGGSPIRSHERYGYTYDAVGNLIFRTNYIVTTRNFYVNSLNQLTNIVRPTTSLVVAGSTTGNPTNVFVWGSGLSTVFLNVYKDGTWSTPNAMPFDGMNTYTAVAQDAYGRTDTNTVSVYSPTSMEITYDANGNMTSDGRRLFEYDDENQLIRVTVTNATRSDFVYDGKMRRRARIECVWNAGTWVTNEIVHYVYDGNLVIQERHYTGQYPDLKPQLITYTRGLDLSGSLQGAGGIGGLLARSDSQSSAAPGAELTSAYYHCDGNGNIIALVDQNDIMVAKYFYDAFGNIISATGPLAEANLYRFSSKEFHASSGLVYYLYRYYEPSLQRWINRDPIGDAASLSFSFLQSRLGAAFAVAEIVEGPNLYRFVAGSPVSFEDPWGLACGSGSTEYIVPDSPIFDFREACENHDNCYGTCGASKRDCDKQFLKDMKAAVRKAGPMSPALGDLLAYTYYSAVVTMGEGAFKAAQKEACMQMCIENGAGNMNGDIGVIFR